jgi:hypothetical protein
MLGKYFQRCPKFASEADNWLAYMVISQILPNTIKIMPGALELVLLLRH